MSNFHDQIKLIGEVIVRQKAPSRTNGHALLHVVDCAGGLLPRSPPSDANLLEGAADSTRVNIIYTGLLHDLIPMDFPLPASLLDESLANNVEPTNSDGTELRLPATCLSATSWMRQSPERTPYSGHVCIAFAAAMAAGSQAGMGLNWAESLPNQLTQEIQLGCAELRCHGEAKICSGKQTQLQERG